MNKIKKYKNVDEFSRKALGLNDYNSWLISTKNKIIAHIVHLRKIKNISQKDLAKILGTTQSVISRIENGTTRHITLDFLMKVVASLGGHSDVVLKKSA